MGKMSAVSNRFVELPFGLEGRIYRSPMPFKSDDRDGNLFHQFQNAGISDVVILAKEEECLRETGKDLESIYEAAGLRVVQLPIPDYGVPTEAELFRTLALVEDLARSGRNIVIHCNGGLGRTGMFLACLAKRILALDAEQAINWVRRYIPGAIETRDQVQMIFAC